MRIKKYFCFILVAVLLCFAPATIAQAEEMDTRTMALINKPGVVFLYTTWSADVVVPDIAVDQVIYDDMWTYIESMLTTGEMADSPENYVTAYITLLTEWLPSYAYLASEGYTQTMSVSYMGTGFIVTPDGYIVTNAHVVETNEDEMKSEFAAQAAYDAVMSQVDILVSDLSTYYGVSPSQEQIDSFTQVYYDLYTSNMTVSNLTGDFQCYMGNVTPGSDVSAKALTMDLRKKGESIPGKDVAILKVDQTNLPTVTLGDDNALKTGDTVYAMGYPAVATVNEVLDVNQAIQEPTLTSGIISAKKQMSGGWDILQTDADIHGGNSGGPLFNAAGEVVGINTFGMIDDTGASASGMNFAVPISIAKQFLNEINVQPSESDFTKQYKQAISLYDSGDYKGALEILRTLNEINPGYPVIADLLSECSSKASTQTTESAADASAKPSSDKPVSGAGDNAPTKEKESGSNMLLIIVIIAAAAAAVVVVLLVLNNKKKAAGQQAQPAYTQAAPIRPQQPPVQPIQPQQPPVQPQQQQQACPQCGASVPADSQFCPKCGFKMSIQCKNCGAKLNADTVFCPKCGTKNKDE